jgi:transposase
MKTAGFEVGEVDRAELRSWLRSQRLPQALGMRARVVMLSVEGYSLREIAERLGVTQRTVWLWRRR